MLFANDVCTGIYFQNGKKYELRENCVYTNIKLGHSLYLFVFIWGEFNELNEWA